MSLTRLHVREFSAFEDASLQFAEGLNVFIGVNGTGKTHVMKLAYSMLEAARTQGDLSSKLIGVFRPDGNQAGRLVRRKQGLNTAKVTLVGSQATSKQEFTLHTKGQLRWTSRKWGSAQPAIFLPSREILALYEGFIHAYRERELSFDETYYDACVALNANPIKGIRKESAEKVVTALRKALGGHVELHGNRFYVKFGGDRARMEAHLVAEGLRKIASLERLVLNGSLTRNSYLFWDEPEANLNPKLTVLVADILGELAREGVQIFVTTHDFLLARRLSISTGRDDWPPTQFFVFYRPTPGSPVSISQGTTLEDLPENPISDEFARHYEFEMQVPRE